MTIFHGLILLCILSSIILALSGEYGPALIVAILCFAAWMAHKLDELYSYDDDE